eukprot:TRINITY_DN18177_c0_g1_i2.p1 TRINITY_DN18177_c0_g1~~TRINITY_DN18177_c0_g1_i2.p1  ORF type:complete len:468 (+),score=46.87 TRINITY_DN18177_c0_g1_i2:130-1533(+)
MILWLVVQIFIWQNYAKTTKTMNGDECDQFPQQYNGVQYSNCFQVAGKNLCYTTNGQLEECVPLRTTLPGNTCEFPFEFNHAIYYNCAHVLDKELCKVNGTMEQCLPEHPSTPSFVPQARPRTTINGQNCVIPFNFSNVVYYDCVQLADAEFCRLDDEWVQCAQTKNPVPLSASPDFLEDKITRPNNFGYEERRTIDGRMCVFPFEYLGFNHSDCIPIGDGEFCVVDGYWMKCEQSKKPQKNIQRYTVNGDKCDQNYEFNGVEYSGCIIINGFEYCEVVDKLYKCEATSDILLSPQLDQNFYIDKFQSPSNGPRVTVDGFLCEFPIIFRGVAYMDCLILGGKEQCWINEKWEFCAPITNDFWDSNNSPVPYQYNNKQQQQQNNNISLFSKENFNNKESQDDDKITTIMKIIFLVLLVGIVILAGIIYFGFIRKDFQAKQKYRSLDVEVAEQKSKSVVSTVELTSLTV